VARDVTAHCDMREHRMLTLGQAARIGTVPATFELGAAFVAAKVTPVK
jgi:hypothetical protein